MVEWGCDLFFSSLLKKNPQYGFLKDQLEVMNAHPKAQKAPRSKLHKHSR